LNFFPVSKGKRTRLKLRFHSLSGWLKGAKISEPAHRSLIEQVDGIDAE
jgi:hypothetical protein